MEDSDTPPDMIIIESGLLSVYTLAYKDEVQKMPDTGERRKWPYAVIILMSGVMLNTLRKMRRKSTDM